MAIAYLLISMNSLTVFTVLLDVKPGPSTSKDMDEAADDLHDPEDPLSPEYVPIPKPPPEPERKVKLETTEGSNGEPSGFVEKVEDHDIDDGAEFDEDTNPLEPDIELGADDEEGGEGSAAMFSSGGHFLNGGGDDDEDDDGERGGGGGGDQVFLKHLKFPSLTLLQLITNTHFVNHNKRSSCDSKTRIPFNPNPTLCRE